MIEETCDECGWKATVPTGKLHPEMVRDALRIKVMRHVAQRHVTVTEPPDKKHR